MTLLINRIAAIGLSAIGVLEVMAATVTIVCSFALWGSFCDQDLECSRGVDKAVGFWLGFPLLLPGILGVVVLATRTRISGLAYTLANLVLLVVGITHLVLLIDQYETFWEDISKAYDADRCVTTNMSNGFYSCKCTIPGQTAVEQINVSCALIPFGANIRWAIFVFNIVAVVLTILGTAIGAIATKFTSGKKSN